MSVNDHAPRAGVGGARWTVPLAVAVVTFVVFLPVLRDGFVTWDDDRNFLDNLRYRGLGWANLAWMWTTFHLGHYVPLAWMTLGLDYTLWGMNPAGYHLTNLVLHTANAMLLYFIARRILRLTGVGHSESGFDVAVPAAFAALVFAVHPLRVESVAWVTERRDVLSELFYLSSILIYLRRCEGEGPRGAYGLALGLFACALLSKATAVTLPAVLLLLNVYPLQRVGGPAGWWTPSARRVYRELILFAVLAAATVPLTFAALAPPAQLTIPAKLAVSMYSLSFYLWKTVAPVNLSPLYAMPANIDPGAPVFVLSGAVAVIVTLVALSVRRRWPGVTAAWLAFLVIILPMLGAVQNGPQIAADRYTYHATPPLAILAGAAFSSFVRPLRLAPAAIGVAILTGLSALSWRQTRVWHDSETLWSHVVHLDPRSSIGNVALANLLAKQDKVPEAIDYYERGLAADPAYAEGHNNLGVALARQGRLGDAIAEYQRALMIRPRYDEAQNNWGIALAQQGDLARAIEHYGQALAINASNADAETNWGNALVRLGKPDDAIVHYQAALNIRPDDADAHHNWGVALARQGKLAEAIEHFRQALVFKPDHADAKTYLERATQMLRHQQSRGRRE